MEVSIILILGALLVPLCLALLVTEAGDKEKPAGEIHRIGRETRGAVNQVSQDYLRKIYRQGRRR